MYRIFPFGSFWYETVIFAVAFPQGVQEFWLVWTYLALRMAFGAGRVRESAKSWDILTSMAFLRGKVNRDEEVAENGKARMLYQVENCEGGSDMNNYQLLVKDFHRCRRRLFVENLSLILLLHRSFRWVYSSYSYTGVQIAHASDARAMPSSKCNKQRC